ESGDRTRQLGENLRSVERRRNACCHYGRARHPARQQAKVPKKPDRRTAPRGLEHVTIECVTPEVDGGRYAAKRVVGDTVWIGADIFRDGHDQLAARVIFRSPADGDWRSTPLQFDYNTDRWYAPILVDQLGRWTFTVEAWTDVFSTWRDGLKQKYDAGVAVQPELPEGAALVKPAAKAPAPTRPRVIR